MRGKYALRHTVNVLVLHKSISTKEKPVNERKKQHEWKTHKKLFIDIEYTTNKLGYNLQKCFE